MATPTSRANPQGSLYWGSKSWEIQSVSCEKYKRWIWILNVVHVGQKLDLLSGLKGGKALEGDTNGSASLTLRVGRKMLQLT